MKRKPELKAQNAAADEKYVKMSILKWQKNDLAMTQEVIIPECVFLCRQRGGGRQAWWKLLPSLILEYVLVVGLCLSTKGEDLKKTK